MFVETHAHSAFSVLSGLFLNASTLKKINFAGLEKEYILKLNDIFCNKVLLSFDDIKQRSDILHWSVDEIKKLQTIVKNITGLSFKGNHIKNINVADLSEEQIKDFKAFFEKVSFLNLSNNDLSKMKHHQLANFLKLFPSLDTLILEEVDFLKLLSMWDVGMQPFPGIKRVTHLYFCNNQLNRLKESQLTVTLSLWSEAFFNIRFINERTKYFICSWYASIFIREQDKFG